MARHRSCSGSLRPTWGICIDVIEGAPRAAAASAARPTARPSCSRALLVVELVALIVLGLLLQSCTPARDPGYPRRRSSGSRRLVGVWISVSGVWTPPYPFPGSAMVRWLGPAALIAGGGVLLALDAPPELVHVRGRRRRAGQPDRRVLRRDAPMARSSCSPALLIAEVVAIVLLAVLLPAARGGSRCSTPPRTRAGRDHRDRRRGGVALRACGPTRSRTRLLLY